MQVRGPACFSVGQRHHAISADLLAAKAYILLCAPARVVIIRFALARFAAFFPWFALQRWTDKETFLDDSNFTPSIWKYAAPGRASIVPAILDTSADRPRARASKQLRFISNDTNMLQSCSIVWRIPVVYLCMA